MSEEQRIVKSKRRRLGTSKRKSKKNPVDKLTRKFKKNGLNYIHARYNALCVYYTYKSSNERKLKYYVMLRFLYFLAGIFKFFAAFKFFFSGIKSSVKSFYRKNKKRNLRLSKRKRLKRRIANISHFLVPALSCLAVFLIIKNINTYEVNVKVSIDGEYFGIVKSVSEVEDIKTIIEKDMSSVMNFSYSFTHSIEYVLVPVKNAEYLTQSEIYNKIYSLANDTVTDAYGLYVDGKLIGAVDNKEQLDKILEDLLNSEETADNEKIEYATDVQIIKQRYSKTILTTPDIIQSVLVSSAQISKAVETSSGGDGADDINEEINTLAENIDIDIDIEDSETAAVSLFSIDASLTGSANPIYIPDQPLDTVDADGDFLTLGESMMDSQMSSAVTAAVNEAEKSNSISRGVADTVKNEVSQRIYASIDNDSILDNIASDSDSYYSSELHLKRIRNESYNETIPFTVEYSESDNYYIGTEITLSEGEDGINYATDIVTYIDDEEVGRVRDSTVTLKHPQNKIVLKGSMKIPEAVPTGNFIMPVKPIYTGAGVNLTGEGGDYHRGIDYVANCGTPIYASDGGTVLYAGEGTPWSYGIYVKLVHSNGMETIYAHMSEVLVETGDKVFQGQTIGKVGNTGNSFGDHLHFEMFKNGALVDPKLYIKK